MGKWLRLLAWTAIIIGSVIGLARATAIRWWRVPTMDRDPDLVASLGPTLLGGDLVIAWRLTKPGLGDLAVCEDPEDPRRVVIGRIAAEGGEQITVEGSQFTVDGKRVETERACLPNTFEAEHPDTGEAIEQHCQVEVMRGQSHMRGAVPPDGPEPAGDSAEVPPGHFYLLSDNRLLPYDSRHYGTVEQSKCSESVVFRLVGRAGYADAESRFTFIQ